MMAMWDPEGLHRARVSASSCSLFEKRAWSGGGLLFDPKIVNSTSLHFSLTGQQDPSLSCAGSLLRLVVWLCHTRRGFKPVLCDSGCHDGKQPILWKSKGSPRSGDRGRYLRKIELSPSSSLPRSRRLMAVGCGRWMAGGVPCTDYSTYTVCSLGDSGPGEP